jgi:hypothetical protein
VDNTVQPVVVTAEGHLERNGTVEAESCQNNAAESNEDDLELIRQAEENYREEKIFVAARLLRRVQNPSLLSDYHHEWLSYAKLGEDAVEDLISPVEEGWNKQGESHGGHRDAIVYYKIDEKLHLKCRLESPIESSLLVPLMSVFNESELFATWMPHWHIPFKMGVRRSLKLLQQGRCHQIIQVTTDLPWPLAAREIVISAMAMDAIDEESHVAVKMTSLSPGEVHGGIEIPAAEKGIVRMDFDGGVLFRQCPLDHPSLAHSKTEYPANEHLLLVSLTMHIDAKVSFVPLSFINFVTRTAIGRMWHMLLHVAEQVREGKRPEHAEAIANKKELYEWIEKRVDVMFEKLEKEKTNPSEGC